LTSRTRCSIVDPLPHHARSTSKPWRTSTTRRRPRRKAAAALPPAALRPSPDGRFAMLPARFEYHRPASLDEALGLLGSLDDAKVLAGGQSLIPVMKLRFSAPSHLVDVNRLPGLDRIDADDGTLRIGARPPRPDGRVRSRRGAPPAALLHGAADLGPARAEPRDRRRLARPRRGSAPSPFSATSRIGAHPIRRSVECTLPRGWTSARSHTRRSPWRSSRSWSASVPPATSNGRLPPRSLATRRSTRSAA
jgi:hypothetical protein